MTFRPTTLAILCATALVGCENVDAPVNAGGITTEEITTSHITFEPLNASGAKVPVPNDLLIDQDTGFLDLPVEDPANVLDPYNALNTLDGWSTNYPFVLDVTFPDDVTRLAFDPVTFELAEGAIRLFNSATYQEFTDFKALVNVDLTEPEKSGTQIQIVPTKALPGGNRMLLAVTDLLEDSNGESLVQSLDYQFFTAPPVEGGTDTFSLIRQSYQQIEGGLAQLSALTGNAIGADNIVYSASLTTQTVGKDLAAVRDTVFEAEATEPVMSASQPAIPGVVPGTDYLFGFGSLSLPYFQTYPTLETCDPTQLATTKMCAATLSSWQYQTGIPASTDMQDVEVLITTPSGTKPAAGWPVAIFSHGITGAKDAVHYIAGSLANAGIATVSIDHPLHGSRSVDFLSGQVPGQDGVYEISASAGMAAVDPVKYANANALNYANLANLLTARDNLRQSASDLLALRYAINDVTLEDESKLFDPTNVTFVGHSLGASVGAVFVALADSAPEASQAKYALNAAALNVPGVGLTGIMAYGYFGDLVKSSLTATDAFAEGIAPSVGKTASELIALRDSDDPVAQGTWGAYKDAAYPEFLKQFLFAAQTVTDRADPLNYLSMITTPVHLTKVDGDETIPNSNLLNGLPLSGTDPMIAGLAGLGDDLELSLPAAGTATHGSLVTPDVGYLNMQTELATFLAGKLK